MTFLLDTNVVSELAVRAPSPAVTDWLRSIEVAQAFLSVVTLAEIRRGVELAKDPIRRQRLEAWFEDEVLGAFWDRILVVDAPVADLCGRIVADCQLRGRPMQAFDAVIAATAQVHGLTLVTRNVRDFETWGGELLNPWDRG